MNDNTLVIFPGNSASFKCYQKITGSTGNDSTKNVEIKVPLNYLSNFRRTLEMPLINCEINLIPTWSNAAMNQGTTFTTINTKFMF